MGAPKQKWTQEEESALKAGVVKHGAGKWRTILKDPEFSSVLYLRSNVDLKDKWRNMSVMVNGWGSRDKARVALRRVQQVPKQDEYATSSASVAVQSDEETGEAMLLEGSADMQQTHQSSGPKRSIGRLDNLIMEAITDLKEPGGSNKTTIATYIEVKRKYRIAPTPAFLDKRRTSSSLLFEGRLRDSPNFDKDETFALMKSQIDLELAQMRTMSKKEAAAAAARAVADAEAAIAEAEEAAREAEQAEADAEAAQAFAELAMKTWKARNAQKMNMQMIRP
ncbi:telomere repeat-binding factor 1 isoform X2 [Morus notabilis]|uniref:telomere repeat-binding factor 1 isoform X2 n=1 Tax=Morus notabilis TaxID=981085 RepID=UPI000CED75BB|nr:telomere repeat-binding factor 1 isoform X2 [Morus notabilis]